MLFTSLEFLLMFLPVTLGVYFLLPLKAANPWLLAASLFFYAWGEPVFVGMMGFSILFNYLMALWVAKARSRAVLALDAALNLAVLFVFKYLPFTLRSLKAGFPSVFGGLTVPDIHLPLGISFFTFQAVSYVVDVYRGTPVQKNPLKVGLYISLFPQLVAGPIVRYASVREQLERRKFLWASFNRGAVRFMRGFCKKVLLANTLAQTADPAFAGTPQSVCMAWLGAVCYALQLYFDFSGYSDMAIGLGGILGFSFPENFDDPYLSGSVTEFWRRWHMSLGAWFRDYVYIPLGGSRVKSRVRLAFNLMCVWLLTGLWHGANWTFVVWGGLLGAAVVFEKWTDLPNKKARWPAAARGAYRAAALLAVLAGWVIFRSDSLGQAWTYLGQMAGRSAVGFAENTFVFRLREAAPFLAAGILCAAAVPRRIREALCAAGGSLRLLAEGAGGVLLVLLFLFAVTCLVMNAHDPFIYFNF